MTTPLQPWRAALIAGLLSACALSAGCGELHDLALEPDVEIPILLGPATPIGIGHVERSPLDEEYSLEIGRLNQRTELGRDLLFGLTCVENATIYAGRYDGILILVPVSGLWIGVEGDIVQVRAPEVR